MNPLANPSQIDSAIRFFLYVLIFWLPYSPAVVETCVCISILLWILKRSIIFTQTSQRDWNFKKKILYFGGAFKPVSNGLNPWIALFLFMGLLSVVGSIYPAHSFNGFLNKTFEWFIIYWLVLEVFVMPQMIHRALAIFTFTIVSTSIDSLIQFYLTNKDIFLGREIIPHSRVTAAFNTPNTLAAFLTSAIPVCLSGILIKPKAKWIRFLTIIGFFCVVWSLYLTFTRGAWQSTVLSLFFFWAAIHEKLQWSGRFLKIILPLIFIILVFFFNMYVYNNSQFSDREWQSTHWRLNIWVHTLSMIADRPFFGHGLNTYMTLLQEYDPIARKEPTYAHNCYLQLIAETGILGFICFSTIIFELFRKSMTQIRLIFTQQKSLAIRGIGLLSGLFAFLISSFSDNNFYSLQLSSLFWVMAGMLMAANNIICKQIKI